MLFTPVYTTFIFCFYNSDSTYVSMSDQISIKLIYLKASDFNYITSVSVNHEDGSVDISCYIDNTAIISRYEVDRTEKETQKFNYIGDIPFPSNGDMIYYRDEVWKNKRFFLPISRIPYRYLW